MKADVTPTPARTGYFLLSFDAELAWGYHDCFDPTLFSPDGQRERRAVDSLLSLLEEFQIPATWAFVGHLFYEQCENCVICPVLEWQGKHATFESIYDTAHPLWYGADIIDRVLQSTLRHEIGFHGYTHRVFDAALTEAGARTEIEEWLRIAARKQIVPQTVIFPRNQIGYLDLFRAYGFSSFRGEEPQPALTSLPILGRFFRRYYYELAALWVPPVFDPHIDPSGLVNLPSSRWLFGFNRTLELLLDGANLHTLRLRQIVTGIKRAAQQGKSIHIWAHPWEFRTQKDVDKLRYLLSHVAAEIESGRMQAVTMQELAARVRTQDQAGKMRSPGAMGSISTEPQSKTAVQVGGAELHKPTRREENSKSCM
jgi:peptidoglycan/xylan/chitin deacetylase (PgdA/CDA1 family)